MECQEQTLPLSLVVQPRDLIFLQKRPYGDNTNEPFDLSVPKNRPSITLNPYSSSLPPKSPEDSHNNTETAGQSKSDFSRNSKSFPCPSCDLSFESKSKLEHHLQKIHGKKIPKPFPCPMCPYRGKRRAHVTRHIACIHTNEKFITCQLCDFKSKSKMEMTSHLATHRQPDEHPCSMCDLKFERQGQLKKHLKGHVNKSSFQCRECDFKTSKQNQLKAHQTAFHTGSQRQECLQCGRCQFSCICSPEYVTQGQRRGLEEEGERSAYKCESCDFTCMSRGRLAIHKRIHEVKGETFERRGQGQIGGSREGPCLLCKCANEYRWGSDQFLCCLKDSK